MTVKLIDTPQGKAVLLPEEVVEQLGGGESLTLHQTHQGYLLASEADELQRQIQCGEEAFRRYPNTLKELAK